MATPRIEIDFEKIAHNARFLKDHYATKGIEVIGVTKAVCGNPDIANTLLRSGISILADSRIRNIKKMKDAGITSPFLLLRTPLQSELNEVIEYCHISHNTEFSIIKKLSSLAVNKGSIHKIILMIELGDLREGILSSNLASIVARITKLKGIELVGIGTNLACFGGIKPGNDNMGELSSIATTIEEQLGVKLKYVSGGNSANYQWFNTTKDVKRINYLRLGESIYLGCDPLTRKPIPGLFTDAFTLVAEVIESNTKPSVPVGDIYQDAFGQVPQFEDKGLLNRVLLGFGIQDVTVSGLRPRLDVEIMGASSDHVIVDTKTKKFKVGTELKFDLNYAALLSAMTSPYVTKNPTMNAVEYCEMVERKDQEFKLFLPATPIAENHSKLVSLKNSGFNLIFEPSVKKDYKYLVREEVVEKVGRISKLLDQEDKTLIIRSVWRSFDHQKIIWDNKVNFLLKIHPGKPVDEIHQLVAHFIAPPEKSMHSTGGAIDALIYDIKSDCVMDFGTNKGLDIDLNEKCFPYHPDISATATQNRKLLINLFEEEDFVCDNKEYWHFDYGNAVWAAKLGKQQAFYDVVKRLGQ
jgi:predicted amino acid racemase/D-alanyl-D-alanine dipeptidase